MVQRILQLKLENNTIYAHEIRTQLQREFGKFTEIGNYAGPQIPSISSINRILRTNSDPSSFTPTNDNSQSSLQSNQLSSFYYSTLNNTFATPSVLNSTAPKHLQAFPSTNATSTSSFGNLYDPWPTSALSTNSSFGSSGYSSFSSGSNSPTSSSGSSSPTEFGPSFGFRATADASLPSHYTSSTAHLSLFNGLLSNSTNPSKQTPIDTSSSIYGNETAAAFNPFHCPSQTSLSTGKLQSTTTQSSLYYPLSSGSSIASSSGTDLNSLNNKKKSRKYTSFNINEILRMERSDEEDIEIDVDDE